MSIALFTIASSLHKEAANRTDLEPFITDIEQSLGEKFEFCGDDFSSFGTHDSDIIYVRTGGTEGKFKSLNLSGDIRLLASGKSNSLAASMEILSYLRQNGQSGEILYGSAARIAGRIRHAGARDGGADFIHALGAIDMGGIRLGVIGRPSDWLISSDVDYRKAKAKLNVDLVDIPMSELLNRISCPEEQLRSFAGSEAIYDSLKSIISEYRLGGITLRCFDLLDSVHNTGCLALARLNAEGIPGSCEGDIPALLTMAYLQKRDGCPGFQCNLSRIEGDNLLFAHCTVPLSMACSYRYDTHFESGIGTAIKAEMKKCRVEIIKISPDLENYVSIPGEIIKNTDESCLCRTQIVVKAEGAEDYFLTRSLANHHIVSYSI